MQLNKKDLKSTSCTCTPKQNIITKIIQNILAVRFSGIGLWLPRRNDKNYARLILKVLNDQPSCQECKLWCAWHIIHQLNVPMEGQTSITSLSQTGYSKSKTLTWENEIAECMLTLDNRDNYQMTQRCYSDQPLRLPDPPSEVATDQKMYYLQS